MSVSAHTYGPASIWCLNCNGSGFELFDWRRSHTRTGGHPEMSMGKLRRATDIKELRRDFDSIRSTVAGDTRFGAQAIMFIAEKLDALTRAAPKREPTAWQRFFAAGMKAGKTPAEIGAEWRARRAAGNRSSGSENGVKVVKDGVSVTDKEPGQ